ncbi:MAG: AbrB/MazE/SpoVT family DNA-binding domain-containing protein [Candidatus Firestonebacteria bacterium]
MSVTISVRGQMVIPSEIRKKYGIFSQSKIEIIDTGKEIILVPLPKDSFCDSFNIVKGVGVKDLIKERRHDRRYEHKRIK